MRSDYVSERTFEHILSALTIENRLALIVSLTTGLRIDDVLHLKTSDVLKGRFSIKEMKTGKIRRVRLGKALQGSLISIAGRYYVFEHRLDPKKTRTRQAVNKDLKRACELFRVSGVNVTPHTARKIYAVGVYERTCDFKRVQELLNHSNESVTTLYAIADSITAKNTRKKAVHVPEI
jgi:integrase